MLVKKINSEWKPKENEGLEVGGTIEMTDPKELILGGDAVAIDSSTGAEISAFELYGVVVEREFEEYKKYQQEKSQQRQAEKLQKEQEELQNKIKEKIAEDKKLAEASTVVTEEKKEVVETPVVDNKEFADKAEDKAIEKLSWKELTTLGTEKGIYKVGMKKEALVEALKNAK